MDESADTVSSELGEPVERISPKKKLGSVVSVRFNSDEIAQLRQSLPDGNLSQFVRQAALAAAQQVALTNRLTPSWSAPNYGIAISFGGCLTAPDSGPVSVRRCTRPSTGRAWCEVGRRGGQTRPAFPPLPAAAQVGTDGQFHLSPGETGQLRDPQTG
jgi:hypothetical protein